MSQRQASEPADFLPPLLVPRSEDPYDCGARGVPDPTAPMVVLVDTSAAAGGGPGLRSDNVTITTPRGINLTVPAPSGECLNATRIAGIAVVASATPTITHARTVSRVMWSFCQSCSHCQSHSHYSRHLRLVIVP